MERGSDRQMVISFKWFCVEERGGGDGVKERHGDKYKKDKKRLKKNKIN